METFYRTHSYLVEHTNAPVRRDLMDEIDWNDRLIGIKGTRGVGRKSFVDRPSVQVSRMEPRPACLL